MRRSAAWTLAAVLVAVVATARPAGAQSAEAWVMLPFTSRGVDATATATFAGLLQAELARTAGAYFVTAPRRPCPDGTCAVAAARSTGARFVVWGETAALGSKVIVTVSTADAARNAILCVQRVSARRVEELDQAAVRIARAVAERRSVDTVTEPPRPAPAPYPPAPAYPPPAPSPHSPPGQGTYPPPEPAAYPPPPGGHLDSTIGFMLRLGGIIPLGEGYAGNPGGGVVLDLGFWWEKRRIGVEPRVGVRFDAVSKNAAEYVEVPLDVGVFFLITTGDVVPFVGGGFGARYFWERRAEKITVGEVIPATSTRTWDDSAWGVGLYARLGLMLKASARGSTRSKFAFTADYNVAFVKVNDFRNPTSVILAANVIF